MNKSVLITGITGFVGSHLAEYILNNHKDWKVYGTKQTHADTELKNLSRKVLKKVTLIDCDLRDRNSVYRAIKKAKPSKIFQSL